MILVKEEVAILVMISKYNLAGILNLLRYNWKYLRLKMNYRIINKTTLKFTLNVIINFIQNGNPIQKSF